MNFPFSAASRPPSHRCCVPRGNTDQQKTLMMINHTGHTGELVQAKLKMLKASPVADFTPSDFCHLAGLCWGLHPWA